MAVTASITPGAVVTENSKITVSLLNQIANPTVDLSGSIQGLSLGNNAVYDANVNASAAIQFSKLANLNTGQIVAGNAGVPTATTLGGDATIDASGNLTIAAGAVEQSMIGNDAVGTNQIADDSVTAAKIADGAVGADQLASTAVTAGSYTSADLTVDSDGRITAASSGTTYAKGMEVFTSSGTFTVPSGITKVKVTCVGGGQGGGNSGSGAQGGVTVGLYDVSSVSTVSVTVGSGGVNSNSGGGDSSFGSFATAGGGNVSGGTATGGDINLTGGEQGSFHFQPTPLGYGRNAGSNSSDHAKGYGAGGGSDHNSRSGADGIVIVEW